MRVGTYRVHRQLDLLFAMKLSSLSSGVPHSAPNCPLVSTYVQYDAIQCDMTTIRARRYRVAVHHRGLLPKTAHRLQELRKAGNGRENATVGDTR